MAETPELDFEAIFEAAPTPYLILTPDFTVVAVNRAYEHVTGTPRDRVVCRAMFEAFPDDVDATASASADPASDSASSAAATSHATSEDTSQASGAAQLRASFERVLATKAPDAMSLLRYAVADETGTFTTHWWSPLNAPVLDEDGEVVMLLHRAERVTDYYLRRQHQLEHSIDHGLRDGFQDGLQEGQARDAGPWEAAEADLYARGGELRASLAREQAAAERLARLVEVSVRLSATTSIAELIDVVVHRGLSVLGASGGAVAIAAELAQTDLSPGQAAQEGTTAASGHADHADHADHAETVAGHRGWDLVLTGSLGTQAKLLVSHIPADSPLPVAAAARTGQVVTLSGEQECLAFCPEMADALRTTGLVTWLSVPLLAGGTAIGAITAGWAETRTFTARELEVVHALAAQCAQTLQRLQAADVERRAVAAERRAADVERQAAEAERRAGDQARRSAARQGALVAIARALAEAGTHREVLTVVAEHGITLLGAAGAGLALTNADATSVQVLTVGAFSADVQAQIAHLPAATPLPIVRAAVEGTAYFLPDRAAAEVLFPGCGALYAAAHTEASAEVPLRTAGRVLGTLSTAFTSPRVWTGEERELMEAFAAMTAQALARITAHEAEQAALASASGIAQTLQRSMLTAPPEPDHLQIAVRYAAVANAAEVGGDWYDAFITSEGLTSLVIGDVTGHDMRAASVMGQLRNLVRGIAFTLGEPPAKVLAATDRAMAGLGIDTIATAIVAQVEQDQAHRAAGTRLLRWSNAGHLPPLLIEADGAVSFLEAESDLVLGWEPSIDRHDHEVVLAPGSTVLMYTDGLVERRGAHLERGLAWLAQAVAELADSPTGTLEELCDALVALVGDHLDDDVALLALRAHPEDAPRPVEAGPVRVPEGLDAAIAAAPDDGGL